MKWSVSNSSVIQYQYKDGELSKTNISAELKSEWTEVKYKNMYTLASGTTYMTHIDLLGKATLAIYDEDLILSDEHSCEGSLIGIINDKWLLFDELSIENMNGNNNNIIIVKSIKGLNIIYRISTMVGFGEDDWARACGNPTNDGIAVVFREAKQLCIFDGQGMCPILMNTSIYMEYLYCGELYSTLS